MEIPSFQYWVGRFLQVVLCPSNLHLEKPLDEDNNYTKPNNYGKIHK